MGTHIVFCDIDFRMAKTNAPDFDDSYPMFVFNRTLTTKKNIFESLTLGDVIVQKLQTSSIIALVVYDSIELTHTSHIDVGLLLNSVFDTFGDTNESFILYLKAIDQETNNAITLSRRIDRYVEILSSIDLKYNIVLA